MQRVTWFILFALIGVSLGSPAAEAEPVAGFVVARLKYDGGGDWYSNPSSLPNLARALRDRTPVRIDRLDEPD